jgi:hypothetical protein
MKKYQQRELIMNKEFDDAWMVDFKALSGDDTVDKAEFLAVMLVHLNGLSLEDDLKPILKVGGAMQCSVVRFMWGYTFCTASQSIMDPTLKQISTKVCWTIQSTAMQRLFRS